ncbi:cyclin-G1-like [Tachypleus tridentatus]|uniref:cyclin-G1-like n=1 Tax=Tachypleus tridentatus TaxID=6853 RepID=UPI003FD159D7
MEWKEMCGGVKICGRTVGQTWSLLDKILKEDEHVCHQSCRFQAEKGKELVTGTMRDNVIQVLKCLKVWYDLPLKVFIITVQTMDLFLEKVKAQPKHLSCIALSCLHLCMGWVEETSKIPPSELIRISQITCSTRDLQRMEGIIIQKLNWKREPLTSLDFLELFYALYCCATQITSKGISTFSLKECTQKLEVVVCNHKSVSLKRSIVALAVLSNEIENQEDNTWNWKAFIADLRTYCKIKQKEMKAVNATVKRILSIYNQQCCLPDPLRQRLSWKLSVRTVRHLRLFNRWRFSQLAPICEHQPLSSGTDFSNSTDKEENEAATPGVTTQNVWQSCSLPGSESCSTSCVVPIANRFLVHAG